MIIKKEKNIIELANKFFSVSYDLCAFLVKILGIKPRKWICFIYLFFIIIPSTLQAASLPMWNEGNNSVDTSFLFAIQLDKNIVNYSIRGESFNVKVKNTNRFDKWFSEFIRETKEIIFFIPYFCEYMSRIIYKHSDDETAKESDYLFGFHKFFLAGLLFGLLGQLFYPAQRKNQPER